MTARVPAAAADRSGASAHEAELRGLAATVALALARAVTPARVAEEAARQLERVDGIEAAAVALTDGDDPEAITAVATTGGLDSVPLAPLWRECAAAGITVASTSPGGGTLLTTPLQSGSATLGAATVLVDLPDGRTGGDATGELAPPRPPEPAERIRILLGGLAVHVAAAAERVQAVHRLERRSRLDAIGEVAVGLAHELRNPLVGISGAAQLLRFRVTEDPVVEKNVGRVLREVEQLNTVVSALLDYGRTTPLRLGRGDPDSVWDDVLADGRGKLESRALRVVRTRAESAEGYMIDAAQLARAFAGLLDNAVDAAPEGSDLALTSTVLPSGAWRGRLANGGASVPAKVAGRVFELFFTTKPNGTGVGLPLAQRIVEEHRGRIAFESTDVAGTAVTVTLPRAGTESGGTG